MEDKHKNITGVQTEKLPPVFVNNNAGVMEKVIKLEFPLEYDGAVFDEIRVRRPLMGEWKKYLAACQQAIQDSGPGADDFIDQPWISAPTIVLENLDFMDGTRVEQAMNGFFGNAPST